MDFLLLLIIIIIFVRDVVANLETKLIVFTLRECNEISPNFLSYVNYDELHVGRAAVLSVIFTCAGVVGVDGSAHVRRRDRIIRRSDGTSYQRAFYRFAFQKNNAPRGNDFPLLQETGPEWRNKVLPVQKPGPCPKKEMTRGQGPGRNRERKSRVGLRAGRIGAGNEDIRVSRG